MEMSGLNGIEEPQSFIVKNMNGTWRFKLHDILYFYSDRRRVILVTSQSHDGGLLVMNQFLYHIYWLFSCLLSGFLIMHSMPYGIIS